jgi:hypothetical protein
MEPDQQPAPPPAPPPPLLRTLQELRDEHQEWLAGQATEDQITRSANAILVGATLVATVTYAAWLLLPFSNITCGHYLATKVFWVFNSLSFYSAIATVWVCVGTVWPYTRIIRWPFDIVERRLKFAIGFFAFSCASVVTAYSSGAYVVVPKHLDFIITNGAILGTIIAGAVPCGYIILIFLFLTNRD